jgi:hypothetical protein
MKKQNKPGFRLTEMWVFVSIDTDGDEGIMGGNMDGEFLPFVTGRAELRDALAPKADVIAKLCGVTYEIRHFVQEDT